VTTKNQKKVRLSGPSLKDNSQIEKKRGGETKIRERI